MPVPRALSDLYHRCTARIDIGTDGRYGSGFFVAPGQLLTCAHVVRGDEGSLTVYYQGRTYGASVVKLLPPTNADDEHYPDLAILKTKEPLEHPCVHLDAVFESRQHVYSFGYSGRMKFGEPLTAKVDGSGWQKPAELVIKLTDAQVVEGLSGAPLLNEETLSVCGMVYWSLDYTANIGGLAIPGSEILGRLANEGVDVERWHRENPIWLAFLKRSPPTPQAAQQPGAFLVPGMSNTFFVGREDVFEKMRTALQRDGSVGLTGLGGVGKTQAAAQYAYRHRTDYRNVLWAAADDTGTLTKSFIAIAASLGMEQTAISDDREIVAAVRRRLESSGDWLLMFDNADSPAVVAPFVPNGGGHVIVTSRRHDLAALNVRTVLDVPLLKAAEATEFLLRRTSRADDRERADAGAVAALVGYLPLALEQAGAHVLASSMSFAEYADALRRGGLTVLERGRAVTGDYKKTVATTWRYAFTAIDEVPVARELLVLSAFLSPDDIPLELAGESGHAASPEIAQAMEQEDPAITIYRMLEPLVDYSLVTRDVVRRSFAVHRLVQDVIRSRLTPQDRKLWASRAVELTAAAQPEVHFSAWDIHNRLMPHVRVLAEFVAQYGIVSEAAGAMLDRGATYLFNRGRLVEALSLAQKALAIRERLPNAEAAVSQSLTHVANIHRDLGQYDAAEPLYRRALAIRRRRFPRTGQLSSTLVNMGSLFADRGSFAVAERHYREALAIQERLRPRDELRIAEIQNNLALVLDARKRFTEAAGLHRKALAVRRAHARTEPLEYAQSLNNFGVHYVDRDDYRKAGPFFAEALPIFRKYLDPSHPDVVMCVYNTALVLDFLDQNEEAEKRYRWAIEAWQRELGASHPDVALAHNSLGTLLAKRGSAKEARAAYQRALAIVTRSCGARHPYAVMIRANLRALATLQRETVRRGSAGRSTPGMARTSRVAGGIRSKKGTGGRKVARRRFGSPRRK